MSPFLFISLCLCLVWVGFLFASRETRKEQLIMSLVGLFVAPSIAVVSTSYGIASEQTAYPLGIADMLFSFCLFGIAAIIYHVLMGKHAHKWRGEWFRLRHKHVHWVSHLFLILALWAFVATLFFQVFAMPPHISLIIGALLIGIYIIADRHDLLLNALLSGIFTATLVFLLALLFAQRLFLDPTFGNLPLQHLIWAATVGFTIGPLYEWLRKLELR